MGVMKISAGPSYQKTGSARHKRAREMTQLTERIFADLFAQKPKGKQTPQTVSTTPSSAS